MFFISNLGIQQEIINIFLLIIFLNISFFILGDIFFNVFSIKNNNYFYLIVSGVIIYFLTIFIFYFLGILINLKSLEFKNLEIFREFFIIFLFLLYFIFIFKYNKKFNIKNLLLIFSYFSFSFIMILFFIFLQSNINLSINDNDKKIIDNLNLIITNDLNISNFNPYDDGKLSSYHSKFQTFYFLILNFSIFTNNSVEVTFNYFVPIISIIFLTSSCFTFLLLDDKKVFNTLLSVLIFILFFNIFLFSSNINGIIFVYFSFLYYFLTFYIFENYFFIEEKNLFVLVISFFLFFTVLNSSIFLLLIFSVSLIFILIEKKVNFFKILNLLFFIFSLEIFLIFIYYNIIYLLILSIVIFPISFFLFSINYNKKQKNDLKKINEFVLKNKNKIYFIFLISYLLFILLFFIEKNSIFIDNLIFIFDFKNNYFLFFMYLLILNIFPIIYISFFLLKNEKEISKIYYFLIPSYILFLNPISLSFWNIIFSVKLYNFEYEINLFLFLFLILESLYRGKFKISRKK